METIFIVPVVPYILQTPLPPRNQKMTAFKVLVYNFVVKIIGWLPTFVAIALDFCKLPKLETWKDVDKFYVYLETLINSDFAKRLTSQTPFYLDDAALQQLQIYLKDRTLFDSAYDALTGKVSLQSLSDKAWIVWNFINTVYTNRSYL
jgi:hypothetical protein